MKIFNLKIILALVFIFSYISFFTLIISSNQNLLSKKKISNKSLEINKTPPNIKPIVEKINPYQEFRFEDYPVSEIYKGKIASIKFSDNEIVDKEWLQWVVKNTEVDFAGHYLLSIKKCGMWCSIINIIDAKTGKLYGLNVSPQVCLPHLKEEFVCDENFKNVDYRIDSNLLVLFGIRYENNSDGERGFHYYKFEDANFTHLKSVLTKEQRSARQIKFDEFDRKHSDKLDCNKSNDYSFAVVENTNRKKDGYPIVPKDLNILNGKSVIAKIEMPNAEAKNFRLISAEKDKIGFEINVNWGGGNYYYDIKYNFKCEEDNFYLYKVIKDSFSTTNPDSGNLLDKKETKITIIEPNIPIEKFEMTNYLQ